MRNVLAIVVAIATCQSASAADVGLEVLAPISRQDVRQISQIVKHCTSSEITLIRAVQSRKPPFETYVDKVLVFVGPEQERGKMYRLQKDDGKWHMVKAPKI
ncbi:MAG TPA: hypothetical protein VM940_16490 [Chthoniobacterales bacterium]|jgi:hypothetical protein|nr:hypothetical protein [Chthoniobacterales bacterium]